MLTTLCKEAGNNFPFINKFNVVKKYFPEFEKKNDKKNMLECLMKMRILQAKMSTTLTLCQKMTFVQQSKSDEEFHNFSVYEGMIDSCKQTIREYDVKLNSVLPKNVEADKNNTQDSEDFLKN